MCVCVCVCVRVRVRACVCVRIVYIKDDFHLLNTLERTDNDCIDVDNMWHFIATLYILLRLHKYNV